MFVGTCLKVGMKKNILIILSVGIWLVCLFAGHELSQRRPLWNDELYTQQRTIEAFSYMDIIKGKINEGNNGPLFYLLQKAWVDVTKSRLSREWKSEWFVRDRQAQINLRVISNVSMSTAVAVLFYWTAVSASLFWGFVALLVLFGVPSVWFYWVEARPYALWILLTVVQSIFFMKCVCGIKEDETKDSRWLMLTHGLLSLTIAFGAVQSVVAAACLWLAGRGRWGRVFGLLIVPCAIAAFYFKQSPQFKYWFKDGPVLLMLQNVPLEYVILFVLCLAAGYYLKSKAAGSQESLARGYLPFAVLMLLSACFVLGYLKMKAHSGTEGFAISGRYFLFLIPVVTLALVFMIRDVWQRLNHDALLRLNVIVIVAGLLLLRVIKALIFILSSGTFMYMIR